MDDGEESDSSVDYYSAAESLQPIAKRIGDACDNLPVRQPIAAGATPESRSPPFDEDNKYAKKRRPRERNDFASAKNSPLVNHALNGMNTLYVLWANEKLCDVDVEVGGVNFPAHGVVLATHSDFFLRLLLKEGASAGAAPLKVALGSPVTVAGFGRVLGFMYTSKMELSWGTVCDSLQTARALSVSHVVQLGREFLQRYNTDSCLSAMYVAERVEFASLLAELRRFVRENFLAVSRTEEFLKCPVELVVRLLADDGLSVPGEIDVFLAARKWVEANGETGIECAPAVMRQVRFQQIPAEDLAAHVQGDGALMQIPEIRSKVSATTRTSSAGPTSERVLTVSGRRSTNGVDHASISSAQPCEGVQIKEARIVDQSTFSSQPSPTSISPITLPDQRSTDATLTSTQHAAAWSTNGDPDKTQTARIIDQSTSSSQPSSPSDSFQTPMSVHDVSLEKDLYEEPDEARKVVVNTEVMPSPQHLTPTSFPLIVGRQVAATSPLAHGTSPAPWPMPPVKDEPSLPASSQTTTAPAVPRKFIAAFRTTRPISDYRITASNPKALSCGPIAWPVTKLLERSQRPDVIVTVGGVSKSGEADIAGRVVEAFLLDKNEWRELDPMPKARNHHVVHFLNGFLYVVGGSDPHVEGDDFLKPVSSVLKYDVRAGKWGGAQAMKTARIFHEVTALFGQLYVVGGQDQTGRTLATVECYSPTTDRWHYVAPLPSARYGVAVTVYRGRLWVAGGFPQQQLAETSTIPRDVVCYNPFCDEWKPMTTLRVPRCHTSLLEMANKLYVIGGFVGDSSAPDEKRQSMSTIEVYNESRDTWEFVADLWQGRHDANTVTVGDKAYIIGGMEDESEDPLPNVECFDPVAMSWATGLAPLPSARFGHACCVVPGDVPIIRLAKS